MSAVVFPMWGSLRLVPMISLWKEADRPQPLLLPTNLNIAFGNGFGAPDTCCGRKDARLSVFFHVTTHHMLLAATVSTHHNSISANSFVFLCKGNLK